MEVRKRSPSAGWSWTPVWACCVALVLPLAAGCAIPYTREFRAQGFETHVALDGSGAERYEVPRLAVADAATGRRIDDASAVVIVRRRKHVSLNCSAPWSEREPLVAVEPFAKLADLTFHQRGLIVVTPLWVGDTGAESQYATIFAYRPGYVPSVVGLERRGPLFRYPNPVLLRPCQRPQSFHALAQLVRENLSGDEAERYADEVVERLHRLLGSEDDRGGVSDRMSSAR